MRNKKNLLFFLLICLAFILFPRPSPAATWNYTISATDTPTTIDSANTGAVVDTSSNAIYLPTSAPSSASFSPDGSMDYVVMAPGKIIHYSYDQASGKIVENTILNVPLPTNPLSVATPLPYPDVVAVTGSKMYHYSLTGTSMVENSALEAVGLTGATAVGANRNNEVVGVVTGQVKAYQFNQGSNSMLEMPAMEPTGLTSPLAIALNPDNYDMAVLDSGQVKYFNYSGSSMVQNPALAVTGLSNPKAIASAGGNDLAVVDGSQVKQFSFNGSSMSYNAALSVTSGLTSPTCVAVQPGSYDRIIVDGNQVKYYQWNGSALLYNSNLSVTVSGLSGLGSYAPSAIVVSKTFSLPASVTYARVLASVVAPNSTSVTWYLTADGANWTASWRVRGISLGTVCEVTLDNGTTWNSIGNASVALPGSNNTNLWTNITAGTILKWKAVLATSDTTVTPKIAAVPGNTAVELDSDSAPLSPALPIYGSCFTTTTPQLTWTFSDPDIGDSQGAYKIQVYKASDIGGGNPNVGAVPVIDTGKVVNAANQYTVPTSTTASQAGTLWSSGTYQFAYRVMTWDQAGLSSTWSTCSSFCVAAFERPRIAQIVSPPSGQIAPNPSDPTTHIMILPGMTSGQLPLAKAGAKVVLLIDSIGPINSITPAFPYTGNTSTTNIPAKLPDNLTSNPMYPTGNQVNRWSVEFWTDPDLTVCPSGTLVQMQLSGPGAVSATLNAPPYSDGVIKTQGSIYEDWFVVLQGRDNS